MMYKILPSLILLNNSYNKGQTNNDTDNNDNK